LKIANCKFQIEQMDGSLFFRGRFNEFERGLAHNLGYRAAANALGADSNRFPRTVCHAYVNALEIRLELPPGNTGHLRAHATQVLGLAAMCNRITHDGLFSANLTFLRH
jgi:hypothetical protein